MQTQTTSDQSVPCATCKGRGRYLVRETFGDGDQIETWYECGTCQGTGVKPGTDGSADFNIDGDPDDDD